MNSNSDMNGIDIKRMSPAEQIAYVITRIYRRGMTTLSGGNISMMDDNGDMWITPSGVDKGGLTPADIICVRADGSIHGPHRPSSEYPFHKALFATRPGARVVLHAHPPALVAFSIVHQMPDTKISPAIYDICGEIGFAVYDLPGSDILGSRIADEFRRKPAINAVIMENHGTVLCGMDMAEAYKRFETLEYCSRMLLGARALGGHNSFADEQLAAYAASERKAVQALAGGVVTADRTDAVELLKEDICKFAARACQQELMSSALGTVSARIPGSDDFIITSPSALRWNLRPEDLAVVKDGKCCAGPQADPAAVMHAGIYRRYPTVNAIMNAAPPNLMSYAIAGRSFNVRTIPESWILLKDVPMLCAGSSYTAPQEIIGSLKVNPSIMFAGEGILVTGNGLLHAFDRLEVAELSARSLIMAAPIGELCPINDAQVEELRIAFKVK